jgi:predicted amidohydrolase
MRVRTIELPVPPDPPGALEVFLEAASVAPVADVTVFPELCTTGYVLDQLPSLALEEGSLAALPASGFCRANSCWLIAGTHPVRSGRGIVNRLAVFAPDGSLAHTTDKVHLFRQMGEDSVFMPGYPAGPFDLGGTRAGAIVCYDLRFPELSRRLTLAGARIVFAPAQWPESRQDLFRCLIRARSAEAQVFFVGCNIGGSHLGVNFGGGGGVAHPSGALLEPLSVAEGVNEYSIDPGDVDIMRKKIDCLRDRLPDRY